MDFPMMPGFPGQGAPMPPPPPGLLGPQIDPQRQGLLAAAFQGLQASGPSRMPVSLGQTMGQAGQAGMQAQREGQQDQLRQSQFGMQQQMQQMQYAQHMEALKKQQQMQSLIPLFQTAGGKMLAQSGHFDKAIALEFPNAGDKFAKIDPTKYTPESVSAFSKNGDYSSLKPRDEIVADNLGGETRYRTKYSTTPIGTAAAHTVGPDTAARIGWDQFQYQNPSQLERAKLGNEGLRIGNDQANTFFNTGQRPGGAGFGIPSQNAPMPTFGAGSTPQMPTGQQPQSAPSMAPRPMAPQVAPQLPPQAAPVVVPPGLTPRAAAEVAKAKAEMEGKRDFNMTGIGDSLDAAERILKGEGALIGGIKTNAPKPTQSGIGTLYDTIGGFLGGSPNGAKEADSLRSIGGALVSKMPRMEGPQSDKDVDMYREMAGRIGDSTIPIERRLAALQTVRELYGKYEKPQAATPAAPTPASKQFSIDGKSVIAKLEAGTNKYFVVRGGKKYYVEE